MSQQYPPSGGGGWGPPQGGAPDPGQATPGQGDPGQGSGQAYPGQGSGQAYPGQAYPGQATPGQGYAGQATPGQGYAGQATPGQGDPGQAYPAQQPSAPGHPPNIGPKKPGFMHALSAPPGSVRVLWAGVVLMLVSFMAKQVLVDITVQPLAGQLEQERLQGERAAALGEIDVALDKVNNEIAALKDEGAAGTEDAASPADALAEALGEGAAPGSADAVADAAKLKEKLDKLEKLAATRAELDKTLRPKRKKVRDEFRTKLTEAARDGIEAGASMRGRFQTSLTAKLFVDLLKLLGASLVVFSALRISTEPEQNNGTKAYAAVLGGIAFVSMALGGIYAALLG